MTGATDLPAELRAEILAYLSDDALEHLITVPAVANYAFNRLFHYIKIATPQWQSELTRTLGSGLVLHDGANRTYLLFYSVESFAQFCSGHPYIGIFGRLVLAETVFYTQMVKSFWYLLEKVRRVDLEFSVECLFDIEAGTQLQNLLFPRAPCELGLKLKSTYSAKFIPLQFFSSIDLTQITLLSLANIILRDTAFLFGLLLNLSSLELNKTQITDQSFIHLAPSLKSLKLVSLLVLTPSRVSFPSAVEELHLAHVQFPDDDYTIDLTDLDGLRKLELVDNHLVSLSKITLPESLTHLSISNPKHSLGDLQLIKRLSRLVSLTIINCKISSVIPLIAENLPVSLKFLTIRYHSGNDVLLDSLGQLRGALNVEVGEGQQVHMLHQMTELKKLISLRLELDVPGLSDEFAFPDCLEEVVLRTNPDLETPIIKLPSSVVDLNFQLINQSTFLKLKLPKRLRSLKIQERSLHCISNPTLPTLSSLRELNLSNLNLSGDSGLFEVIPTSIENLNLSGNKFTHIRLVQSSRLKRLNLSRSFFLSSLDHETMHLPEGLEVLDIGQNPIQLIDDEFKFPSSLQRLTINTTLLEPTNYTLKAISLSFVKSCVNLRFLHASFYDPRIVNLAELPQSLEMLHLSNGKQCSLNTGAMQHLENLVLFEYSGKMDGVKFLLPVNLQRLAFTDCSIMKLSRHIEIPPFLRLALLFIRGSPLLKEEDLLSSILRVRQKCPNYFKVEVDHGNLSYPKRETIKQLGITIVEHPLI